MEKINAIARIYCPQLNRSDKKIKLGESESHYLLKVLRLKKDNPIILFNGEGGEYQGVLASTEDQQIWVTIGEHREPPVESPFNIHLVYGVARFEKTEWVIQKATELGVHRIMPVMTQHGEVHLKAEALESR